MEFSSSIIKLKYKYPTASLSEWHFDPKSVSTVLAMGEVELLTSHFGPNFKDRKMHTLSRMFFLATLAVAPLLFSAVSFAAEGSDRIKQVTRKSGGALYHVLVTNKVSLSRVSVDVLSAKAKIHSAAIVTVSGRIPLQRLQNTAVIPQGKGISSEYINRNDQVLFIEIRAESFGAVANLRVRATSNEETPILMTLNENRNPPPVRNPQPDPYYPEPSYPQPTPTPPPPPPTPTPPEVVYLPYPFPNYGNQQVTCSASDKGWEEHGAHSSCGVCLEKHGQCTETCQVKDTVVYGVGIDPYGRIAKFEGRGGSRYEAQDNLRRVCDYYRLSRCESDPGKSDSTHSEVISRRSCN